MMRSEEISGVSRRPGLRTTRRDSQTRPAPKLLERRFEADAPNRLWVADIECREAAHQPCGDERTPPYARRSGHVEAEGSLNLGTEGTVDQRQLFLPVDEDAIGRFVNPRESRVRLPVFLVEDGLVTDAQVRRLREKRMSGKTLAAAAGMSERAARHWQSGALPSTSTAPRTWRTREAPLADVWESEVVPQLEADTEGRLQVLKLFTWLSRRHPGRFQAGQLRTLQRRVREWRAQSGSDHEVYFERVAVPGREAAFDFTDASDLGVTIRGVPFPHLLFEWVLSYSKWTYVALAVSETFEALVAGLQGALWMLGAVPAVLRHDNLSAATHELKRSGGRQLTVRFQQVLDHYGLCSSRIQPGTPHENGVAAQAHFQTKTAIEQALLLRGDRDFVDESAYLCFVRGVVDEERNRPAAARLDEERVFLQPLPAARIPEYTTFQCRVRKWSTIRVGGRIYSVPSRLIGHMVEARQHPSTLEVLYGGRVRCAMPRLRGAADYRIDYRHIIGNLVRKPGALARYCFREELFRSLTFRAAYDALGRTHGERADGEYLRLLHLAATTSDGRSRRRFGLDSPPAPRATTPASGPRYGRRSRPSPWCTYPGRTWRGTTRCWPLPGCVEPRVCRPATHAWCNTLTPRTGCLTKLHQVYEGGPSGIFLKRGGEAHDRSDELYFGKAYMRRSPTGSKCLSAATRRRSSLGRASRLAWN